jgi:TolB-like protein/lipoprotein NlpI
MLSAATILVTAIAIFLILFTGRAEAISSIAVLPLENLTGDPGQEYFADGITDELIGQLGRISALRVISRTSVMQYKRKAKPLPQIARELGVDAVLEGSLQKSGDRVRIRVQLIDALPRERNLWGMTYERPKAEMLVLYGEMAQAIAEKTGVSVTESETSRLASNRQVDPEAYEAYLKGQFHMYKFTKPDLELGRQYFELALEKDPDYAPAYHGIAFYWVATTYYGMRPKEIIPKWKAAVEKGIELDSTLPIGHFNLAVTATWYEFDWEKAEREFRLTLELNPNYAQARVFYGLYLTAMGRFEEAKTQMRVGVDLDPMNAMYQGYMGQPFRRSRQYDLAITHYKKSLALQPDFTDSLGNLFHCYHEKGMVEEALETRRKAFEIKGSQDLLEALDRGYRTGGYREAMRQVAEVLAARSNRAYSMDIALYYTYAGEKDRALDWLEIAFEERMQDLVYLNVDPKWDALRNEPRFQEVVRRMKFPQAKTRDKVKG